MRSLILGLLLLTAGVAQAQEADDKAGTLVMGSGRDSCGKFIGAIGAPAGKHREANTPTGVLVSENRAYQEWLMGFVSGFNATHGGELEQQVTKIDLAGMDLWVRNWCNKHPTKLVFDAGANFIIEMRTNAAAARR
jgi:hypothetical protein